MLALFFYFFYVKLFYNLLPLQVGACDAYQDIGTSDGVGFNLAIECLQSYSIFCLTWTCN